MSDRLKFILRVAGFIVACILIALALYLVFFKKAVEIATTIRETAVTTGGLQGAGGAVPGKPIADEVTVPTGVTTLTPSAVAKGGITFTTLLTNTAIKSPTVTKDGTIAYYDPNDGRFYTITADGKVVALSQQTFPKADEVTFSTGAKVAVIEFPDGSNVVYNFDTAKQVTLPNHWQDFSFSNTGNQIAAKSIGTDPSNRALVITSTDGSSTTVVAALGDNDHKVTVNWSPDNAVVGFSNTGQDTSGVFGRQQIYLLTPSGGAAGALFVDGSSFKAIWATDGKHLLYSVADPNNGWKATLWYADSRGDRNGDRRKKISVQTTVDKCTFTTATVAYCAVPREMPNGGGSDASLITAYDDVYKIDMTANSVRLVAVPAADTKIFSPKVSDDGSSFYYTDGVGRLNVIKLK